MKKNILIAKITFLLITIVVIYFFGQLTIVLASTLQRVSLARQCVTPTNQMVINRDTSFCPGTYDLPDGVVIGASDVTLDCARTTLRGNSNGTYDGSVGISASYVDNIEIKNCNIENYQSGLVFNHSDNLIIQKNIFKDNHSFAIKITESSNSFIENNEIYNSPNFGIFLMGLTSSTIKMNIFNYVSRGIKLYYSFDNVIEFNNFVDENVDNGEAIILSDSSDNLVQNNTISNYTGWNIYIQDSPPTYPAENNIIKNNKISGGLRSPTNGYVGDAIKINANNNIVKNNETYDVHTGVSLIGDNNRVLNNLIRDTQVEGIHFEGNGNIAINNTLKNIGDNEYWCCSQGWGMYINGDDNIITLNNLINNRNGIYLGQGVEGNLINLNNIINTIDKEIEFSTASTIEKNQFDFNNMGNYWSSYDEVIEECIDNDTNGYCDNPLIFNTNNQDSFPSKTRYGLWNDIDTISGITGGTVNFELKAPLDYANQRYVVLISLSADEGYDFPGGVFLPIDKTEEMGLYYEVSLTPNEYLVTFVGYLDQDGKGISTLNIPTLTNLQEDKVVYFAFVVQGPTETNVVFASNATEVLIEVQ